MHSNSRVKFSLKRVIAQASQGTCFSSTFQVHSQDNRGSKWRSVRRGAGVSLVEHPTPDFEGQGKRVNLKSPTGGGVAVPSYDLQAPLIGHYSYAKTHVDSDLAEMHLKFNLNADLCTKPTVKLSRSHDSRWRLEFSSAGVKELSLCAEISNHRMGWVFSA